MKISEKVKHILFRLYFKERHSYLSSLKLEFQREKFMYSPRGTTALGASGQAYYESFCTASANLLYPHELEIYSSEFKEKEFFKHIDYKKNDFRVYIKHSEDGSVEDLSFNSENELKVHCDELLQGNYTIVTFKQLDERISNN